MTMRNITVEELLADRRRMKAYIASRIPEEGCRIVLADGPEGEVWVDLNPVWHEEDGWDMFWQTDCPEAVGLRDIYEHALVSVHQNGGALVAGATQERGRDYRLGLAFEPRATVGKIRSRP
jgi:hypothetical protein